MKEENIHVDIGEVQRTLLFPLLARARETEKKDPVLSDTYAKDIIARIDNDLSEFETLLANENHQLGMVIRAYHFDTTILDFLTHHNNAVVINIGAGLDTTFQRVDNGKLLWFNIEMPDVATLRQRLIPDSEREITIAKSVFDFTWINDIAPQTVDRPIIFMAPGVLFYFTKSEVEILFHKLADSYPSARFVFDSVPRFTLWAQNREVKKGTIPSFSIWKWHLRRTSDLRKWIHSIKIIDEYPIFGRVRIREGWSRKMILGIRVTNFLRLYNMNHIQL